MCDHRWREVYEELIMIGGSFSTGWECVDCGEFVSKDCLTPAGLSGTILKKSARLVGPHGGYGNTADGTRYKEQIIDENGVLHIIEE